MEPIVGEPILLSKREAAKSLSISVRTLDSLIATKKIPVRKIGRRVLISRKSLEQFAIGPDGRGKNSRSGIDFGSVEVAMRDSYVPKDADVD